MKFLFASDSFKGTLSSGRTAELLTQAAEEIFPGCICRSISIADGGEGTAEAVLEAAGGRYISIPVSGPLWSTVAASYGNLDGKRAIIEMASASGLTLLAESERNPGKTTSYGTGQLLRDAVERGFREIYVAIGGSATNDGGTGCMRALGVKFLDEDGRELSGCGDDLIRIRKIDLSEMDPRLSECSFTVMCDVKNPLCGENGATYTFGKQKGGTKIQLDELERGMCNYRDILKKQFGTDADRLQGAGAAGGLGAALTVFLGAVLRSGIETVLSLVEFDKKLDDTDLVVTGEGTADHQSVYGKVMQGVGNHCRKKGIPAVAIVGGMEKGAEDIYEYGIESIITTVNSIMPLDTALKRADELYLGAARRLFRMLRAGAGLQRADREILLRDSTDRISF